MAAKRASRRAAGEGSIFEEAGRYRAQLVVDGKTRRRWAATRQEAVKALESLKAEARRNIRSSDARQRLEKYLTDWLEENVAGRIRPATKQHYAFILKQYVLPELGHVRMVDLNPQKLRRWLKGLRDRGLAEHTVANAFRRLSTALNDAVKDRILTDNPCALIESPCPGTVNVNALDGEQLIRLLTAARSDRLYALFALAGLLGLRRGELLGLRWSNVTLDGSTPSIHVCEQQKYLKGADGRFHVDFDVPKTRGSVRTVPLPEELVAVLHAWRKEQTEERLLIGPRWIAEDLVFTSTTGTPMTPNRPGIVLKHLLKQADLPVVSFHSLRHTAGSLMLAGGAQLIDVSGVLGHASVATTARTYAHSFEAGRREAVNCASNLLRRKGA